MASAPSSEMDVGGTGTWRRWWCRACCAVEEPAGEAGAADGEDADGAASCESSPM
jgi:hypothetical protein